MSFPKRGKTFPGGPSAHGTDQVPEDHPNPHRYIAAITAALRESLGDTRAGVKTVVAWTGTNERAVKNWFGGRNGPSGHHLVSLIRHSDDVLFALLRLADRQNLMLAQKIIAARATLVELLRLIDELSHQLDDRPD